MATICVFCSSSPAVDQALLTLAGDVGRELAARGHDLVSGGGRVSMMGELARAVRAAGRTTTGVIPDMLADLEVADTDADHLIRTPGMRERKREMEGHADGFLILPGGLGTLEELLEIWVARALGMHDKPVVVCDPDGVYLPLQQALESMVDRHLVRPEAMSEVVWADSIAGAFDALEDGLAEWPFHPEDEQRFAEEALEAEP